MALKQAQACNAIEKVVGKIINKSLCEVGGAWLCLVNTDAGKRLVCAANDDVLLLLFSFFF